MNKFTVKFALIASVVYAFIYQSFFLGSGGQTVGQDISLSKTELIQQKENNQTDSISRSGKTSFIMIC